MERIPLTGEVVFRSSDFLTFSGTLQCIEDAAFSFVYKTEGKYMGQKISGKMIEYFPADSADMYYDISRKANGEIAIGKLSQKSFGKGKLRFRDYYVKITEKIKPENNELIFFETNNTIYVFINDDIKAKEKLLPDNILTFAHSVCKNAAFLSDCGFRVNCQELVTGFYGEVIPAGPFVLPDSDENLIQSNILDFGLMFFRLVFGKDATTFDRRMHSESKRSDMALPGNLSDEDVNVVCNIIKKTIQLNRNNCFTGFAEILNEFKKII